MPARTSLRGMMFSAAGAETASVRSTDAARWNARNTVFSVIRGTGRAFRLVGKRCKLGPSMRRALYFSALLLAGASLWFGVTRTVVQAQTAVPVDSDDIGGVVATSKGPEAGIWVIAETTDLPTKYSKT